MQQQVTVLGVKRIDFDNAGDKVQGTQVWYMADPVNEMDIKGCIPAKAWLDLSAYPNFQMEKYPAVAMATFAVDLSKGKLIPKTFDFNVKK